jgi:putative transposase
MSTPTHYPTDLYDNQWERINPLLPPPKSGASLRGRPASDVRRVIDGILYVTKTGCQWRMLPKDFGCWSTVYGYFYRFNRRGVWRRLMEPLNGEERRRQGRHEEPSGGCVDSQSVKTTTQGKTVGYDGGKKVKGRKRHLLVDTLGLILAIIVTAADMGDRQGLRALLSDYFAKGIRRLRKIWADGNYTEAELAKWVRGLKKTHKVDLEVVERESKGFHVVKRRWVVERTFSWLGNYRRHSKDYEVLTESSEAMTQIAMIHLLVRRLA